MSDDLDAAWRVAECLRSIFPGSGERFACEVWDTIAFYSKQYGIPLQESIFIHSLYNM